MTAADRKITTTTFTAGSMEAARNQLEIELQTGIIVAPTGSGVFEWAAKFERAWGRMVVSEVFANGVRVSGHVIVEVTRATALPQPIPSSIEMPHCSDC